MQECSAEDLAGPVVWALLTPVEQTARKALATAKNKTITDKVTAEANEAAKKYHLIQKEDEKVKFILAWQ